MRIHVWTCSFLDKLSKQQRVRQKGMEVYRKMKNKIRAALIIAVAAGICCVLNRLPAAATQSEIDKVNENINELEQEQEESRQELTDLEADKAYLDGKLKSLNSQLSAAAQELSGLQEQLEAKNAEILLNQQQLKSARQEEEKQYENMKKRIRFLYEKGETGLLEVMLEAKNFAEFINHGKYVESIYEYDRNMLEQYRAVKEDIAVRELRLQQEQQELEALARQQEEKLGRVEQLVAEVKTNLNNTNQQIAGTEDEIADYEKQLEKQKAYEAELEAKKAAEDAKRLEEIRRQEEELKNQQGQQPIISDSESDIAMLAALIECEAGGESYEGKLAVGSVVLNRVRSSHFPNTLVEVIYQPGQFSPVASGRFATVLNRGASASCIQAARENLSGTITVNCLYFRRNTGTIQGIVIGNHVFY